MCIPHRASDRTIINQRHTLCKVGAAPQVAWIRRYCDALELDGGHRATGVCAWPVDGFSAAELNRRNWERLAAERPLNRSGVRLPLLNETGLRRALRRDTKVGQLGCDRAVED